MVSRGRVEGLGHRDGSSEKGVERIDPKHLVLEDDAEIARDGFGHSVEIEFATEFFLHRGDGLRGDATGDD